MTIKQWMMVGLLGLLPAGCKKEPQAAGTEPGMPVPQPAPAVEATAPAAAEPLMPIKHPETGIFLRGSWTRTDADAVLVRPMEHIAMITLDQRPADEACLATDFTGVGAYLEAMRQRARASGMADIGYHWAVDAVGRIWQLRLLNFEGEHSPGRNAGNIGILILGSPEEPLTPAQRAATVKLIGLLCQKFPAIPLSGIVGHDEIVKPDRPGAEVTAMIGEIRKAAHPAGR